MALIAVHLNAGVILVVTDSVPMGTDIITLPPFPQHFRSSEKQATSEGCFFRQSVCSVLQHIQGSTQLQLATPSLEYGV